MPHALRKHPIRDSLLFVLLFSVAFAGQPLEFLRLPFGVDSAAAAASVKEGTFTKNTATGSQTVSGVGFQPKAVIFFWGKQTATGYAAQDRMGMGFATGSSEQGVVSVAGDDNVGTTNYGRRRSITNVITMLSNGTPTLASQASFSAFTSDGFTINWGTNDGVADIIHFIAYGGTDMTNAKVGTFSLTTGTGNLAVTGVGFQPEFLMLLSGGSEAADTNTAGKLFNVGFATSSSAQAAVSTCGRDNRTATGHAQSQQRTDQVFMGMTTSCGQDWRAAFSSFDVDGFTINKSNAPASATTVLYLALRGGQYMVGSFNQATATGNQATSGLGFQPTGLMVMSDNRVAGTTIAAHGELSVGAADSATSRSALWAESSNVISTESNVATVTTKVIRMANGPSTTNAEADLSSFDTDGFTLNWSTADGTTRQIVFWAIGHVTTTIADGTNPSNVSLAPGGSATMTDAFTLQTAKGTDAITDMTVTLATGTSAGLGLVEITNDAGSTVFGSVANPSSDAPTITTSALTATTTSTQYKIRITPKSHANMPAPPGASYATTATVTNWTGTNVHAGTDSSGASVTIDNFSPSNVSSLNGAAGNAQVTVSWTSPGDADFSNVVILRNTSSISDAPSEGSAPAIDATVGSSTVRYISNGTSFIDTGLSNGTTYYYKAFSKDTSGNYSIGTQIGPVTPSLTTTTLANGSNPSNASLVPGGSATMLDAFTLQTSTGSDTITNVTVSLASGTSAGIGLIEVTSDSGATSYGSATNPASDTPTITTTGLSASISATQYKIRITPKTHVNMPAPPGASYAVTGTVSNWTGTNSHVGSDSSSATVTIDNLSPADVTSASGDIGDSQLTISWTNPVDADFSNVVVLRSTAAISDVPTEGTSPSLNATIGASTVRYVSSDASFFDTGLSNGTAYYYKIFSKDSNGNYAVGVQVGPLTPIASTTTIANGTNPSNATLAPGGAATMIDAFTLQTSIGTESVSNVTATLASGTSAGLSLVEITNDAGSTVYGSAANPSSDAPVITTSGLSATTSSTQYKIRITPKSHANMPAPPGTSYAVTATVSDWTGTYGHTGTDSGSATMTIDNASPANVTSASGTGGDAQASISWTNPVDTDFSNVVVLRSTASISDAPTEGTSPSLNATIGASTVRYISSGTSFVDTGLSNGTSYYYNIFSKDSNGNYGTGTQIGPVTPVSTSTTIGDGTNPSNASLAPEGAATMLDAFTLQTSSGSDAITGVTVSFASGTSAGLRRVEITSSSGATVYGSVVDPSSDAPTISLFALTVTTASTQYKIRITPKAHVNMPVPPGATYAVTGVITDWTGTNVHAGSDASSATVTIDNASPADPTSVSGTIGDAQVAFTWTNAADADFSAVAVLRGTVTITDAPVEGSTPAIDDAVGATVVRYFGNGTTFTDTGLANGTAYYYTFFSRDTNGNFSVGTQAGPFTTTANLAVSSALTQIPSMLIPSADNSMRASFTFVRSSGTSNVTSVVIAETGTVNAQTNLVNIRAFYKQQSSCSSIIPSDAAAFNSSPVPFNASQTATLTGTFPVGTAKTCLYLLFDVGSGASNGQTIELQIANPSTDVITDAGSVSPATTVQLSGTTTLTTAEGSSGASLSLHVADPSKDPTVFSLSGGALMLQQGANPAVPITTSSVTVTSLTFTRYAYPGTPGIIRISMTIKPTSASTRQEYLYEKTFIGSAALR